MNRLVIIGNGFDLAHGMKTSYAHFLVGYLKQCFLEAREKTDYEDELVKIYRRRVPVETPIEDRHELKELLYFKDLIPQRKHNYGIKTLDNLGSRHPIKDFAMEIKSEFFKHLLDNCSEANWVDIENEYYSRLVQILGKDGKDGEQELQALNNTFRFIISKLQTYLLTQSPSDLMIGFAKIFTQEIVKDEIIGPVLIGQNTHLPDSTLLLNFNYTDTVERYINNALSSPNYKIENLFFNQIHGKLADPDNPIIFGFGDELDKDYSSIENDKRKGVFDFIKSFWYFKTRNYHQIIRFIDSRDYQVFVIGHSCGLSDRTMLNMIFEHEKCRSIKIFYHQREDGSNNFTELTQEIARHFNNKGVMRKKIVPFPYSTPMPQIKKA